MSGPLTRCVMQAFGLLLLACALPSSAAIVINTTRVVYPQNEREVTVRIDNQGKGPVLLQSWIGWARCSRPVTGWMSAINRLSVMQ
ncbi:TPA: fimbria/pilus periplasmic chaperone [Salmonella enterica]